MISDEQFAEAEAFTAEQIMTGDLVAARLINAILPAIMAVDASAHARVYAILFGTLMGERSAQLKDMGVTFDFDQNLRYFGILSRTIFKASAAAMEAERVIPPVPQPQKPTKPATLLRMVPKGETDGEEVPEQQSSDAQEDGNDPTQG